MFWDCVAASGTGNIVGIEGRMHSNKHHQILYAKCHAVSEHTEAVERLASRTRQ